MPSGISRVQPQRRPGTDVSEELPDLTIIPWSAFDTIPRDRPFTVLVDKDDRADSLRIAPIAAAHPDATQFDENLNWAYAAALMCAKAVVRDEPWSSKIRDGDLKGSLLTMIEWDHRARYGADYDVRFLGSRLRQWIDTDVQDDLESCWGRFDATDSAAALRATIALYARLSTRTAEVLGFPSFDHGRLRAEIESILGSR